jgi:DNA-binding Xre family transcriptional regulator
VLATAGNRLIRGVPFTCPVTVPPKPLNPDEAYGLEALGRIVRQARRDVGATQHKLAAAVGVDQSVISRLENGKLTGLRFRRVGAIIALLDGHVEYWIGRRVAPAGRRLPGADEPHQG